MQVINVLHPVNSKPRSHLVKKTNSYNTVFSKYGMHPLVYDSLLKNGLYFKEANFIKYSCFRTKICLCPHSSYFKREHLWLENVFTGNICYFKFMFPLKGGNLFVAQMTKASSKMYICKYFISKCKLSNNNFLMPLSCEY